MELARLKPLVEKSRRAPASLEGVWRSYPKEDGVAVKIRPLLPSAVRTLESDSLRARLEGGLLKETVDDEVFESKLRAYLIEDWRGVLMHGAPAPVTEENTTLLFDGSASFGVWVLGEAKRLAEALLRAEETELKNSEPSCNSAETSRRCPARRA